MFIGSGIEYKEKEVLVLFAGGCFHCFADWIDYNKGFCYASGIFHWVKGLHDSIVLVVSLLAAIMRDMA